MKIKYVVTILFAFVFLASCDQVDPLNSKRTEPAEPFDTVYTKALLVEFTGHFCGQCPPAAELAHELRELNKGKVSLIAIHAGDFARTTKAHPADYKTSVGDALNTYFAVASYPIATINYKSFDGTRMLNFIRTGIEPKINNLISQFSPVGISLKTDIQNNVLNVNVSATIAKRTNFDHSLAVYLTEDSIQTWQKDLRILPDGDNYNYYHKAVFRASFNGAFGEDFLRGNLARRTVLEKALTLQIDPKWNTKHLKAIALIIDNTTKEIIQVEEVKFKTE